MLQKIISYWKYGKSYCTIEVASEENTATFHAILGAVKKTEFVDLQYVTATEISALRKHVKKNQHAYLVVNSAQVLIRKTSKQQDFNAMVSEVFPGLNLADFYVQTVPAKEGSFVFVCRKEYVDALVDEFKNHHIEVLGFELGFGAVQGLLTHLKEPNIQTSRQEIQSAEGQLASFSSENLVSQTYEIGDAQVQSTYILAAATLFKYFDPSLLGLSNFKEAMEALATSHRERNFFRKGLVVGIALLFGILLINFLVFNSYFKEQKRLINSTEVSVIGKKNYENRLEVVKRKERLLDNILYKETSKSSKYINELSSLKPAFVLFKQLIYQPLHRNVKADKEIDSEENTIKVYGICRDRIGFTDWIEKIEELPWSGAVVVINFASEGLADEFEIEISIEDETAP